MNFGIQYIHKITIKELQIRTYILISKRRLNFAQYDLGHMEVPKKYFQIHSYL